MVGGVHLLKRLVQYWFDRSQCVRDRGRVGEWWEAEVWCVEQVYEQLVLGANFHSIVQQVTQTAKKYVLWGAGELGRAMKMWEGESLMEWGETDP